MVPKGRQQKKEGQGVRPGQIEPGAAEGIGQGQESRRHQTLDPAWDPLSVHARPENPKQDKQAQGSNQGKQTGSQEALDADPCQQACALKVERPIGQGGPGEVGLHIQGPPLKQTLDAKKSDALQPLQLEGIGQPESDQDQATQQPHSGQQGT